LAKVIDFAATQIQAMGIWIFLLIFLIGCVIVRRWQTKNIKFYFQPTFTQWKELFDKTNLNKIRY